MSRSVPAPSNGVEVETVGGVAVVAINRPAIMNALDSQTRIALTDAIRDATARPGCTGLVLTGRGRGFCSGQDLNESSLPIRRQSFAFTEQSIRGWNAISVALLDSPVPTIAAIGGPAVGGGAEIALSCDLRIGSPAMSVRFPENSLGFLVSNGTSDLLARAVGAGTARRLVLSGSLVDADTALGLGLVDRIVDDPMADAVSQAQSWAESRSSAEHLRLFRPATADVCLAMEREIAAARRLWTSGALTRALGRARQSDQDGI